MLGFLTQSRKNEKQRDGDDREIAKLFFDTFSKRVANTEETLSNFAREVEQVKESISQGRVSDLVLLERLQKLEQLIKASLGSIKGSLEEGLELIRQSSTQAPEVEKPVSQNIDAIARAEGRSIIASHVLSPTGELGSLQSMTTPTELQVLSLLASQGPKSAPEIGVAIGRSREHTARLMKRLYEEGYVRRDQARTPFRYSVVDKIRLTTNTPEVKDEEKEEISVPQP